MSELVGYGIDLGTTNSCVAHSDGTTARVFTNNDQMSVTPSVVRILKTGRMVVGKRAYNAISEDPDDIAAEFKRWMGQKHDRKFPASGRTLTAEELSAEVLKSLAEDVKRQTGQDLRASVVTVPAAFGALQCDATARAAQLAGLEQAPLLQEPLAAANAYGADPKARDQRLMVFDLGGGTLDIAVVSTKDGRLNVLEHRGNNLLGGKDIDRRIVEELLLPLLADNFALPDPAKDPAAHQRLFRRLALRAEEAKIDLSSSEKIVVSLVDIGTDGNGKPIEAEIPIDRATLEGLLAPMIEKALRLANEALEGAKLEGKDLDRILLVGGPTQTPYVRRMLSERITSKVDHTLDPMTVVARGAAIYAASIEREAPKAGAVKSAAAPGKVALRLAYEPVSATLSCPVAGKFEDPAVLEVKLDADGGWWTSGWAKVEKGAFELPVMLQEGKSCRFWVYARAAQGRLVDVDPGEFHVRHGLVVSSPPLPHSICVEIARPNGKPELDAVFKRGTPLPAERTVRYRADRTLAPVRADGGAMIRDKGETIAIKLWEGEDVGEPELNVWVGNIHLHASELKRTIPEGAEIEVAIKIDASRLITVEAFVPHVNQHFSHKLYVAQEEEQDFAEMSAALPGQLSELKDRIEELEEKETASQKEKDEAERLKSEIATLEKETGTSSSSVQASQDPDQAKRFVEASRDLRSRVVRLEKEAGVDRDVQAAVHMAALAEGACAQVVDQFGSPLEKKELEMLRKQAEKAAAKGDEKSIRKVADGYESLRWRVLFKQDWFWREVLQSLSQPGRQFVNREEANRWIAKGQEAIRRADSHDLQEAVRQLWRLQPPSEAEADKERALKSGLRRF